MHLSNIYKAEKGLLRINFYLNEGKISNMIVTGDFFLIPETKIILLEHNLDGKQFEKGDIEKVVVLFYATGILIPSVTKDDFINAIMGAKP